MDRDMSFMIDTLHSVNSLDISQFIISLDQT